MREKVFRNSSGFRFNVSFVDCTSVFVKSVLETSLSFIYILLITGEVSNLCLFVFVLLVFIFLYNFFCSFTCSANILEHGSLYYTMI